MLIEKLKEMFSEMVLKKDASQIPKYYHKDMLLITNGIEMNYEKFLEDHIEFYKTDIQYEVKYQEDTLLEEGNKVAGRIWITTKTPNSSPKEIEVILIATYKDDKLHRIYELTFPDWSSMPEFKESNS